MTTQTLTQLEQTAQQLESIFETIAAAIKSNNNSRGLRRKLLKAQQSVDRASGIMASIVEDASEKPVKAPKAKKAPAKKK